MPPRGAHGRAADDGFDCLGQPGERAADHGPVVHDQRRLCRRRLQHPAGGDADRVGPCRGGDRRRLRGVRSAFPRRLRFRCAPTTPTTTSVPSAPRARTPPTAPASSSRRAPASSCSRRARRRARGAPILGSLRGWGMSSDGEATWWRPRRTGASRHRDGARARRPDAPPTWTTSTRTARPRPPATWPRCAAIRAVFGDQRVAYSSTKGYTGHTVSAAGAIEAIFTLLMLRGRVGGAVGQRAAAGSRARPTIRRCSTRRRCRCATRCRTRSASAAPT